MRTPICDRFGIDVPIFAFTHCRDVVAAVTNAGGLGVLGALAFSPEQLEVELSWIDDHVGGKPYGVDVVMPASYAGKEQALDQALGDRRGIGRYGFVLPMDESLAEVAIDLSGRPAFEFAADFPRDMVGGMSTEMVRHFFASLSQSLRCALHLKVSGENTHHMVEGLFKGAGRALRPALARQGTELPSTKGML